MKTYHQMIQHVVQHGTRKENRTGVDTLSTFNYNYEVVWDPNMGVLPVYGDPADLIDRPYGNIYGADLDAYLAAPGTPFPLLTTKDVSFKNILVELLWFLSGSDKSEFLERHGCRFWRPWYNGDGTVKNCYGPAWRKFPTSGPAMDDPRVAVMGLNPIVPKENDQVRWVFDELKRNPMSRRMLVSAWAPGVAQTAPLPPCHALWMFNVQLNQDGEQRLCLHLTQRSCDLALGVPYNLASYALLLLIASRVSGIKPGIFAHSLVDLHIYTAKPDGSQAEYDHVPGLTEQLTRSPRPLPKLIIDDSIQTLADIEALLDPSITTERLLDLFRLEGYDPHPHIPFKVAV